MKLLTSFLKLIRWQNLLFIVLTQALFYTCVYQSLRPEDHSLRQLLWLMVASVCIAAAGYIINDYFDLNIDQVNKPTRNVINTVISRRWAILWHLMFSALGILATVLAVSIYKWHLVLANVGCVLLLWLYSTSFKRQVLIGNIIISLLTAWTILVIYFSKISLIAAFGNTDAVTGKFFRVAFLYAGFAFVLSLIREVIKDVEDMEGDRKYGCRTFPIVVGLLATKIYTTVWMVVLIAAMLVLQLYVLQFGWFWAVVYSCFFVITPLVILLMRHSTAKSKSDFAQLSALTKWIMFAGILSMLFFRLYL